MGLDMDTKKHNEARDEIIALLDLGPKIEKLKIIAINNFNGGGGAEAVEDFYLNRKTRKAIKRFSENQIKVACKAELRTHFDYANASYNWPFLWISISL